MAIHRHVPQVAVSNKMLTDARLSFSARGLMVYLLTHESGDEIDTEDLVGQAEEDTPELVEEMLKELEQYGYLIRKKVKDPETGETILEYKLIQEPS